MSSNPKRLQYLFQQYLHDSATPDELREFWKLFAELGEEDDSVKNDLWQLWHSDSDNQSKEKNWKNMLQRINQQAHHWEKKQAPVISHFNFWRVAAAAIIITMCAGGYFFFSKKNINGIAKTEIHAQAIKNDVLPGGNNAILTLSNGNTIILNKARNGNLALQGNTKILKLNNGQLSYESRMLPSSGNNKIEPVTYNTLSTPRGGQYQVTLPDGTHVWLNSSSSIHYPTTFLGKERKVDITGEAYFEVTHDAAKPFKVTANGSQIEVLGTHFNINAYNDEPALRTTLFEGSIKFINGSNTRLLSPGQQIQLHPNGEIKLLKDVDLDQTIAWKNGLFSFHNTGIDEVMRQLSRWYDVEVSFSEPLDVHLNGNIQKQVNVSQVLKMIELTGEVKFKIQDSKINVMK